MGDFVSRFDPQVSIVTHMGVPCAVWSFGWRANNEYTETDRKRVLQQLGFSPLKTRRIENRTFGEITYYEPLLEGTTFSSKPNTTINKGV
jgi:hypothetical protein